MSKILLVEDNRSLSAVEAVFDGQSAAEMLSAYTYDLVILDWELPGLTGIEVLRNFRQKKGITPVITR